MIEPPEAPHHVVEHHGKAGKWFDIAMAMAVLIVSFGSLYVSLHTGHTMESLVEQNQANLDQARKRLDDLRPVAPEDGLIENTFFNTGEWVQGGTPVVSLLPPSRVKLRFYIPEEDVARAQMGGLVSFTCDTCPADLKARIIYISPRSEFTPPVIYSQTARSKLVFLIEARPEATQTPLPPGLPVSVTPFAAK